MVGPKPDAISLLLVTFALAVLTTVATAALV